MRFLWQRPKTKLRGLTLPASGKVATFRKLSTVEIYRMLDSFKTIEDLPTVGFMAIAAHCLLDGEAITAEEVRDLETGDLNALTRALHASREYQPTATVIKELTEASNGVCR